jgi:hypothetical protein
MNFPNVGRGIFMRKQRANVPYLNSMKIYESEISWLWLVANTKVAELKLTLPFSEKITRYKNIAEIMSLLNATDKRHIKGTLSWDFQPCLVSKVNDERKLTHGLCALWSPSYIS